MKYTDESLKKYPWLWKFDERRKTRCYEVGHRFRWFHKHYAKIDYYIGVCKKCEHNSFFQIKRDKASLKLSRVKLKTHSVEVSFEQARELIRQFNIQLPISHPLNVNGSSTTSTARKLEDNG